MYILGIETTCDETSCAVLKNYKVLSNITISSLKEYKKYGGIIPEIAVRAHLENIDKVLNLALLKADILLKNIGLISVSYKPGLIGALAVGLNFAKALSLSLNKPYIGINHLYAHIFSPFLDNKKNIIFPFLGVVVSGGHTELYYVDDFDKIKLIGSTEDDACGEIYDKIAREFNLGFPGGPFIDKIFKFKFKDSFKFKCGRKDFNLSFSGIKTAMIYKKRELEKKGLLNKETKIKLLSSFQESVIKTLVDTIFDAAKKYKLNRIVLGGGVSANRYLRFLLNKKNKDIKLLMPDIKYTQDNAAMVAGLGFYLYNKKKLISLMNLKAIPN